MSNYLDYHNILYIDSNGKVGVNNSTPLATLSLTSDQGSASGRDMIRLDSPDPTILFNDNTNTGSMRIRWQAGTGSTQGLRFYRDGDDGSNPQLMIDLNGNVGVKRVPSSGNTISLDVAGDARITSYMNTVADLSQGLIFSPDIGDSSSPVASKQDDYTPGVIFGYGAGKSAVVGLVDANDHDGMGISFLTHASGTGADDSAEAMRINRTGDVGINTTRPGAKLHVDYSVNGVNNAMLISNYNTTAGTGQQTRLLFGLARNSGSLKPAAGQIRVGKEQDWTDDDTKLDSYMSFWTFEDMDGYERLRITSNGNVGIGTMDPSARLHVYEDVEQQHTGRVEMSRWELNNNLNVQFDAFGDGHSNLPGWFQMGAWNTDVGIAIVSDTETKVENGTSRRGIFIKNGNVGIGTASPQSPFTVAHQESRFGVEYTSGVEQPGWNSTNPNRLVFNDHGNFWIGAGNGTWFTGAANTKTQAGGLAADASWAHDLLLTTMHSDSTYDRGITYAVADSSDGGSSSTNTNSGWRLGKWHSGDAADSSMLVVDGGLNVKGGNTDEYDYYGDDYSTYRSSKAGGSYWTGDAGWVDPSITASTAIQIQSGNAGTNTRNPALQFHQYGYGGVQIRYDGPNKRLHFEDTSTDGSRMSHVLFTSDNRSNSSANAMILTVAHQRADNNGSGIDLVSGNVGGSPAMSQFIRFYDMSGTDDMTDNTVGDANWGIGVDDSAVSSFKIQYGGGAASERLASISSGSTRLYIDGPTGLMGVGTTDPKEKLHVSGKLVTSQSGGWNTYGFGTTGGYVLFEHDAITVHNDDSDGYTALLQDGVIKDAHVRVQFKTTNESHLGILLRASSGSSWDDHLAVVVRPDINTVRVQQRFNGVQTYLPASDYEIATGGNMDDGGWHELEVWLIDDELVVNVDGVTKINYKSVGGDFVSAADQGRVGLTTFKSGATVAFKNFHVKQLTSKWFLPNSTEVRNNLLVTCKDTETASVQIVGSGSQGTGILKVGQSADYAGGIMYNGDDNPAAIGNSDDVMLFRTNVGNNTMVMRWRYNDSDVDFSGRVGIGQRPGHELDIRAASAGNGSVRLRGKTGQDNHIRFDYPDDSTKYWLAGADSSNSYNSDFLIWNSHRNNVDMVVEHDTGNIGIGTGSVDPETKLHVYQQAAAPVLLTLHNYTSDIAVDGSHGNFIDLKMTDDDATFTPQVRIGMIVEDSDGDGGLISEGCGNFVVYTGEGTDAQGAGTLTERLRVTEKGRLNVVGDIKLNGRVVTPSGTGLNNQSTEMTKLMQIGCTGHFEKTVVFTRGTGAPTKYLHFGIRSSGANHYKLKIICDRYTTQGTSGQRDMGVITDEGYVYWETDGDYSNLDYPGQTSSLGQIEMVSKTTYLVQDKGETYNGLENTSGTPDNNNYHFQVVRIGIKFNGATSDGSTGMQQLQVVAEITRAATDNMESPHLLLVDS